MPPAGDSPLRRPPGSGEPGLAEIEQQFFSLITAPEGVAAGLTAQGRTAAELGQVIDGDARASAVDRLDIYANMYFYRIRDTLRDYFPATAAVVNEAGFHNLITDYLLAHPSRHPSLREVGRHLPGFAATHALAVDHPSLGQLAALEWARLDVFDRADQAVLTREQLVTRPAEAFATLALPLIAAHELLESSYGVEEIWAAVQAGHAVPEGAPADEPRGSALLVWRRELTVYHRRVESVEALALTWLRDGLTFGELCERLADGRSPEAAAQLGSTWLGTWLADGLIAGGSEHA
jgi:hypothetical protein